MRGGAQGEEYAQQLLGHLCVVPRCRRGTMMYSFEINYPCSIRHRAKAVPGRGFTT